MLRANTFKRPLAFSSRSLKLEPRSVWHRTSSFRRNASGTNDSTGASVSKPKSRLPAVVLGVFAGGALLYYFLWPSDSRHAPTLTDAALSPSHFTPVTVYASEPCTDGDTRLITLEVPKDALPSPSTSSASPGPAPLAPVWSVFIKDDDIQVERPYTPLEGLDAEGRMRFWVKRYEKGEVARWLHTKRVGENVEIRGPVQTWGWREGVWDEVVMISGGTGITPFYQLVHQTLLATRQAQERRDDNETSGQTRFTLLHSSCTPGELPPPSVLGPLVAYSQEHPDELKVSLFVDRMDGSRTDSAPMDRVQVGRIGKAAVRSALGYGNDTSWWKNWLLGRWGSPQPTGPTGKRILVLVCGPEAMIDAIAGPYGRNYSQGPVGGVLGELGCRSDQVWKL